MPRSRYIPILILAWLACSGCGGGSPGRPEPGYPPEAPRQPERLVLVAPDLSDPLAWWRSNIHDVLPAETYALAEQAQAAEKLLESTNLVRAQYGLTPVERLPLLDRVAQAHARDQGIRDYWSHHTPEGLSSRQRINSASGRLVNAGGENSSIAVATNTPGQIVNGWLAHPGHCELLLNPEVTHMGAGIFNFDAAEWTYYVQLLVRLEDLPAD